ncbi:unnamed protein product [Adineta ricciae]|uniref:Uncharacterized protein n=1 Tax=Adineta ricciae TaxID=249248 RepID=A0A814WFX5_ADIRI|nr:unnamed protein product [Adineta ricciae]
MVTANLNYERRPSSDVNGEEDENSSRHIQKRLDHLYLDNSQYTRAQYQQSQRTMSSPTQAHEYHMTSNTVPVYRHGRKFYVPIEEFERLRMEQRRQRRTLMQKSQNLPVSKVHQTTVRTPSLSSYNSVHRSTSHPHDCRYGILRVPHLPLNPMMNHTRYESTRQPRLTSRYYDDRDDASSYTSALPIKVSTTTIRSNSSDKVLDLQRTLPLPDCSYSDYIPDEYDLKRSFSAEIVHPPESQRLQPPQPAVVTRRIIPTPTIDYSVATVSSYSPTSTEQIYDPSSAAKLTNYYSRLKPTPSNSTLEPVISALSGTGLIYGRNPPDAEQVYSSASIRRPRSALPSMLTRSSSTNSRNDYYYREATSGSFSDDNSSSPSMLIQRRNTGTNRYRRSQTDIETDDDYRQRAEVSVRPTARSHSSDGLTEKKRVRFADMEGYTLETVPDVEQDRSPTSGRSLNRRAYAPTPNHFREQLQHFHNPFYPTTNRASNNGSKLATDV